MSMYTLKDGSTKWIDDKDVHLWEDKIVPEPDPNQSILNELECLQDAIDYLIRNLEPLFDSHFDFRKPDKQPEAENQMGKPLLHNQPLYNGSGNTKLFQTKIDRDLAEKFKVLCAELGTTQKDMVERWIVDLLGQYNR